MAFTDAQQIASAAEGVRPAVIDQLEVKAALEAAGIVEFTGEPAPGIRLRPGKVSVTWIPLACDPRAVAPALMFC
jgi:hypothetical protein